MFTWRLFFILPVLLISACGLFQETPQAVPPAQETPQEIQRNQTQGLHKLGTVTARVRGAPSDGEAAIQAKAAAAGASYYVIIVNNETVLPGQWYIQAILYR